MPIIKVEVTREQLYAIDILRVPFGFDTPAQMIGEMVAEEIPEYQEALEDDAERLRTEVEEKGRELRKSQEALRKLSALSNAK